MLCQVRRIDSDLAWPCEARPWPSLIESGLGLEHDLLSVALALDTQAMALWLVALLTSLQDTVWHEITV